MLLASFLVIVPMLPLVAYGQTGGLQVLSSSAYRDSIGYLHVFGEVKNDSKNPMTFVKITATFYGSAGEVVGTSFAFTDIETLRQGERSSFEMILLDSEQVAKTKTYKASVTGQFAFAKTAALELEVGEGYLDDVGYYHLVGELTNTGSEATTFVKVAAAFHDGDGKVIASSFAFTDPEDLLSHQTAPFEMIVLHQDISVQIESASVNADSTHYSVINDNLQIPAEPEALQPSPQQQPVEKSGTETVALSPIGFTDIEDNSVAQVQVGSMVLITTKVTNNNAKLQPFVIIVEIRDANGITLGLQIQKGTLNPNSQSELGVSWQPMESGTYQLRAVAMSSLKNPEVLSPFVTRDITV